MTAEHVNYQDNPAVTDEALNTLFAAAWPEHSARNFRSVLAQSSGYVCAYAGDTLVGFVNVAWDGGIHAFLLDTTVHPTMQRQGVGHQLVRRACDLARKRGCKWLHVDYAPEHRGFYLSCGFRETQAALIDLQKQQNQRTSGSS